MVMKKLMVALALAFVLMKAGAQNKQANKPEDFKPRFGLKAGYNWSYITGSTQGFNPDDKSGFMVAAFFSPSSKGLGFRTELVFSRQGYSFDEGGQNTDVLNDYIYLPQLTTYTIGKRVQFQLGAQIGFLLNSKKQSGSKDSSITEIMNKFDYGFAGGVEIYPIKNLILGGRYNLGLGKLFKQDYQSPNPYPLPFNPETTNFKNGLFQFFAGWRF
jgi:opacity protein-like surface antigen